MITIALIPLLLAISNAKSWTRQEKEAVFDMSRRAAKAIFAEIDKKADDVYRKTFQFFPIRKRGLLNDAIRDRIRDHMYEEYGRPTIKKIPFTIKESVEQGYGKIGSYMEYQNPRNKKELIVVSNQISEGISNMAQRNMVNDYENDWRSYQRKGVEAARKDSP